MCYLYFYKDDEFHFIGTGARTDLNKLMFAHHDENFPGENIYYVRQWVDEEGLEWADFGSWSSFYVFSDKKII